jgi:phage-related protein
MITGLFDAIVAIGKGLWDGITSIFTKLGEWISSWWNNIWKTVGGWFSNIGNNIGNWWKGLWGYATGTNNATSGLHLVGEAGPELIDFRGGERVYNASNTEKILSNAGSGGNSFNVTFNNTQDTTAYAMMKQLKLYQTQLAINGVL